MPLLTSQILSPKNVDAGKAKKLMEHLVKLQSSIPEVNKYTHFHFSEIPSFYTWIRTHQFGTLFS